MEIKKGLCLKVQGGEDVQLGNWDTIKDKILFKLINTDLNREALKDAVSVEHFDMSIVFYIELRKKEEELVSLAVTESLKNMWGVNTTDIYNAALENTQNICPVVVTTLWMKTKELAEDLGVKLPELPKEADEYGSYVLTNTDNFNGAAVIMYKNILTALSETMGSDLYIIPGSIHEVVALKADNYKTEDKIDGLFEMLMKTNKTMNTEEEILSDNIFKFTKDTGKMSIVPKSGKYAFLEMLKEIAVQ